MAARAISSGTISFGLVSIPIKVYPATRSRSVSFNLLHAADKSRLKQQYVSASTGEVVPRSEMVRGYEYARGQYVVMTDEELKALHRKSDQSIEIEEFVPIAKVDPIFFDRSYLLGPDKGGAKAYRLLRDAMSASGRVAVGRYATRGKQQLVILRPVTEGLVLHGLFYADEVRDFGDVEMDGDVALKENELKLAQQLIDQLSSEEFEAGRYEDEYRQEVLEAIDRKVAGEEVVVTPPEEARDQIIDLVAALKQSLAEKRGEPKRKGARRKAGPKRRSASG